MDCSSLLLVSTCIPLCSYGVDLTCITYQGETNVQKLNCLSLIVMLKQRSPISPPDQDDYLQYTLIQLVTKVERNGCSRYRRGKQGTQRHLSKGN